MTRRVNSAGKKREEGPKAGPNQSTLEFIDRLKESRDAGKVWCTPDSTTSGSGPPKASNLHAKVVCRVTPSTQLRQSELAQIKCNLCNESVRISSKDSHRFSRHHRAIQTLHYGTAYILEEKVECGCSRNNSVGAASLFGKVIPTAKLETSKTNDHATNNLIQEDDQVRSSLEAIDRKSVV